MVINSQLFEAYLKCATKCYLKATGETGTGNAYAEWLKTQNEAYRIEGVKHLTTEATQDGCINSPIELGNLRTAKWRLAINFVARAQNLESTIHVVERVPSKGKGKPKQFIPIRFVFTNKISKSDKFLLAFDAFVFSKSLGRKVNLGKIIHGDNHNELKVKVSSLASGVEKSIEKIFKIVSTELPPDFILNKHCSECEFQEQCRKKAIEKDELSLLAGMSEKERKKLHGKGIFTVTQLSYTFRPRRRPKRMRGRREKYHHPLKALAIREQKTHVVGNQELKIEGTPVYLDVEGIPDQDFYCLIGVRIKNDKSEMQHSLWAANLEQEKTIWIDFLNILSSLKDPILIHYGSFEVNFLKQMHERYGGLDKASPLGELIKKSVNILSLIYARVYFPVYSNGLKAIARSLGFKWSDPNGTGTQSILWRKEWEQSHNHFFKMKITIYNAEDCKALEEVTGYLENIAKAKSDSFGNSTSVVVNADTLPQSNIFYKFKKIQFSIPELDAINSAAYWNYQRERILLKSNHHLKKIAMISKRKVRTTPLVNKIIHWLPPKKCPQCGELRFHKISRYSKTVVDIKFTQFGIKRWILKYIFYYYRCASCRLFFQNTSREWNRNKFGLNIRVLSVYLNIELLLPFNRIATFLNQLLGFNITRSTIQTFKIAMAEHYKNTYNKILQKILNGKLIHIDETKINLNIGIGYVWVFTSCEDVVYIYTPTREGDMVAGMLSDFKGVLVSDFYTAYDSLNCPQQKCLIHLIRDLNDVLLKEPFNEELKYLVADFAALIKIIIDTVNRFGLKKRFLRKHNADVNRFFKNLLQKKYSSETAYKCKIRLEKNRTKLFTFLDYNGIPWNNNNAEHAIKPFAWLRNDLGGVTTEKGIQEYLILLSICETCKYKELSFLEFLRSGETDLDAFAQRKVKRKMASPTG